MTILAELLVRTLCDVGPNEPVDGAYLFSQTADNEQSVFDTGVSLHKHLKSKRLLIADSEPRSGYAGFAVWQQALQDLGVPQSILHGVPTRDFTILHTLVEATALVRYAQNHHLKSLIVVSPPFHLLRAFMTTVTVALQNYPDLRIFSQPGKPLPWLQQVIHSQGTLQLARRDLIHSEMDRIKKYQAQGDLASPAEVLTYLNNRDEVVRESR